MKIMNLFSVRKVSADINTRIESSQLEQKRHTGKILVVAYTGIAGMIAAIS